eukprot:RCo023748
MRHLRLLLGACTKSAVEQFHHALHSGDIPAAVRLTQGCRIQVGPPRGLPALPFTGTFTDSDLFFTLLVKQIKMLSFRPTAVTQDGLNFSCSALADILAGPPPGRVHTLQWGHHGTLSSDGHGLSSLSIHLDTAALAEAVNPPGEELEEALRQQQRRARRRAMERPEQQRAAFG